MQKIMNPKENLPDILPKLQKKNKNNFKQRWLNPNKYFLKKSAYIKLVNFYLFRAHRAHTK